MNIFSLKLIKQFNFKLSQHASDWSQICPKVTAPQHCSKGIVSQDWRGLQMILLHRSEVFIISASCFFLNFVDVFIQYF